MVINLLRVCLEPNSLEASWLFFVLVKIGHSVIPYPSLISQSGRIFSRSLSRMLELMGAPPLLTTRVLARWAAVTAGCSASIVTSGGTTVR